MKFKKSIFLGAAIALSGLTLFSCSNKEEPKPDQPTDNGNGNEQTPTDEGFKPLDPSKKEKIEVENVELMTTSDTLYVEKVDDIPEDFIYGMDASSVISEEESGVKYYDYDGTEADPFKVLAESGINYIRVRVWNDPYDENGHGYGGGNNDIEKAVAIGKRATKYGMKLMVDFHYSDFWADPAKQAAPKAWQDLDIDSKADALYKYTRSCLEDLYYAGVDVGMVQVGNESNAKLCGETNWAKICQLMNAGSKAIREVFADALVAVHFTNPEKANRFKEYSFYLNKNKVDYDVFAASYYPYWHGTLENLKTVLEEVANTYDKKVMVAETSYAYTTENTDCWANTISTPSAGDGNAYAYPITIAGQTNHVRNVIDTIAHTKNGIGVCYWEGTWISVGNSSFDENNAKWEKFGSGWASSYASEYDPNDAGQWHGGCAVENQAFFDETGHTLESLKVFNLVKTGNTSVPKYVDGADNVACTFLETDDITLPTSVNVVYNTNERSAVSVTWDGWTPEAEYTAKNSGNAKYEIHGIADGTEVYCTLTILEYNYVQNYSFENGMNNWTASITGTLTDNYKVGITGENPATDLYGYHFWAKDANTCKFYVEQVVAENGYLYNPTTQAYDGNPLDAGTYKYQVSFICGGATNDPISSTTNDMYSYVKINGVITKTQKINGAAYSDGQIIYLLKDIVVSAGDTVTIGVYVDAAEAGVWGSIDDAMFNKQR